jgi:hypothetical protein
MSEFIKTYNLDQAIAYVNRQIYFPFFKNDFFNYIENNFLNPSFYYCGQIFGVIKDGNYTGYNEEGEELHPDVITSRNEFFDGYVTPFSKEDKVALSKLKLGDSCSFHKILSVNLIDGEGNYFKFYQYDFDHVEEKKEFYIPTKKCNYTTSYKETFLGGSGANLLTVEVFGDDCVYLKNDLDRVIEHYKKNSKTPESFRNNLESSELLKGLIQGFAQEINILKNEAEFHRFENILNACGNDKHENYAPELHAAICMWNEIYNKSSEEKGSHTTLAGQWLGHNTESFGLDLNKSLQERLTIITTPLKIKNKNKSKNND